MPLTHNSYGSAADVAALTDLYTDATTKLYTSSTIPTLNQVENWINEISALINTALAGAGFIIPINQVDAVLAIKGFVIEAATDLAHAANSAGRYFTDTALERGITPRAAIRKSVLEWVETFADGLDALGASRSSTTGAGEIGFRSADNSGNATFPLFQREAFGDTFQDWDT